MRLGEAGSVPPERSQETASSGGPAGTCTYAEEAGWDNVRRLLAFRLGNMGDLIMLGPSLRALRQSLPDAHITLMTSSVGACTAPLFPWVDAVMAEDVVSRDASSRLDLDPGLQLDPAREPALVARIAERGFDAALIFTSSSQSPRRPAHAFFLAGVPIRVAKAGDFEERLLTHVVPTLPPETHQVDRNLHLLEGLGFPVAGRHLEVRVPPEDDASAGRLLASLGLMPGRRFVALAPGASCSARRYPPERFATVAGLLADTGVPVVVVGSANETELVRPILNANRDRAVRSLVGTELGELAAVLSKAALVVTNGSGPMHLADAVGCPQVVLFSGTDLESQWRPRRSPSRLLRRPTPCAPCYRFDCPFELPCLDIPPEEVVEYALELLGDVPIRPKVTNRRSSALPSEVDDSVAVELVGGPTDGPRGQVGTE